jgi:hypothetical protein
LLKKGLVAFRQEAEAVNQPLAEAGSCQEAAAGTKEDGIPAAALFGDVARLKPNC